MFQHVCTLALRWNGYLWKFSTIELPSIQGKRL
jgi:hypothetical protein